MEKIIISEFGADSSHLSYVYHTLNGEGLTDGVYRLSLCSDRIYLEIQTDGENCERVRSVISSAIADIICIGYKYVFLKKYIVTDFLSEHEREVFFASLIAADFKEDKKYVLKRIKDLKEYSIDGIFNFRLKELEERWEDVISYIPEYFTRSEFESFILFLLEGEGRVYIKDDEVYDNGYKKMRRSRLIPSSPEYSLLREIILSGADSVCCLSGVGKDEELFLKKYYGDKVFYD